MLVRLSVPAAWFAAFVFAIHPVHVESHYQTAIHYFERALRADPTHVTATYNLSAMYDAVGDPMQAARYREQYQRLTGQ